MSMDAAHDGCDDGNGEKVRVQNDDRPLCLIPGQTRVQFLQYPTYGVGDGI